MVDERELHVHCTMILPSPINRASKSRTTNPESGFQILDSLMSGNTSYVQAGESTGEECHARPHETLPHQVGQGHSSSILDVLGSRWDQFLHAKYHHDAGDGSTDIGR